MKAVHDIIDLTYPTKNSGRYLASGKTNTIKLYILQFQAFIHA